MSAHTPSAYLKKKNKKKKRGNVKTQDMIHFNQCENAVRWTITIYRCSMNLYMRERERLN